MRLEAIRGHKLPFEVSVYGWRWPEHQGEGWSKAVFAAANDEADRLMPLCDGPCSAGVYRAAEPGYAWFVWIVDVGVRLRSRSDRLGAVTAERAEPTESQAVRLAMRHLRMLYDGWIDAGQPTKGSLVQRGHYGLGAILDDAGFATVPVGRDD